LIEIANKINGNKGVIEYYITTKELLQVFPRFEKSNLRSLEKHYTRGPN
jgi:hypothetical protein